MPPSAEKPDVWQGSYVSKPVIKIRQSELSQWRTCRRKTAFQYWEGYKKNRPEWSLPPSKAKIGTIVHSGLEVYYRDGIDPAEFVTALGKEVESKWAEQGHEMGKEWKDGYNLAYLMCKGYTEWVEETGVDAGIIVTGVEREIEVYWGEIDGCDVYVVGHIDLEFIDALGRPSLLDHKSVAGIAEPSGPADFQRLTYGVLRRIEDGTTYAALYHNQLKRVKRTARATPPFYARHCVVFNDDQMRKHYAVMDARIRDIVRHRVDLANGVIDLSSPLLDASPNRDCSWACPYYDLCPMVDDGSDWQWYLGEEFIKGEAHVPGQDEEE